MAQWQVSRDGKKFGPFDDAKLREMASSGKLKPTDHVWAEGMKDWVEASKLKSLFQPTNSPPPPPAPRSAPSAGTPTAAHKTSGPGTFELENDFANTGVRPTSDDSDWPQQRASTGGQSSKLPRVLTMLFVLLILAGGGFLVAKQMVGGNAKHLQYMPDGMSLYMHFDLDSLQDTEAWSVLQAEVSEMREMIEALQERTGFRADDLRSTTSGIVLSGDMEGVTVFQFNRPLEMLDDSKIKQSEIEGFTVYQDRRMAFALLGNGAVLIAKPDLLTKVLKRGGGPELTPEMNTALSNTSGAHISIALDYKAIRGEMKTNRNLSRASKMIPGADTLVEKVESGCITATVGSDAQVNAVIFCEDSETAEAIKTLAAAGVAAFQLQLPNERMPKGLKELLGKTLATFEISASGNEANASIDVPLIEMIKVMPKK